MRQSMVGGLTALLLVVGCASPEGSPLIEGPSIRSISPAPPYPPMAAMARLSGEIQVRGTLGPEGQVLTCASISGPRPLRPAAEAWVRQWIFQTAQGEETSFQVKVRFRMADDKGTEALSRYPWCVTGTSPALDTDPIIDPIAIQDESGDNHH